MLGKSSQGVLWSYSGYLVLHGTILMTVSFLFIICFSAMRNARGYRGNYAGNKTKEKRENVAV